MTDPNPAEIVQAIIAVASVVVGLFGALLRFLWGTLAKRLNDGFASIHTKVEGLTVRLDRIADRVEANRDETYSHIEKRFREHEEHSDKRQAEQAAHFRALFASAREVERLKAKVLLLQGYRRRHSTPPDSVLPDGDD